MRMSNRMPWLLPGVLFLICSAGLGLAQQKKEVKFSAQEPVLITSAGQSADVQMIKILAERNKIASQFDPQAGVENLAGVKSVIIVIGGSAKGLGAAGIDADKEAARIQKLLAKVKEQNLPLIGMHIGGKAKRGELSDRFIQIVAPKSSFLMILKEGDYDEIFSKVAAKNKISILLVDRIADLQQPLKSIYGKPR